MAIESSQVFANLGKLMFAAVSRVATGEGMREALEQVAAHNKGPVADMAELGAVLWELGRLGTDERQTATRMVVEFLTHERRRRRY
jgi:hypothetical protein